MNAHEWFTHLTKRWDPNIMTKIDRKVYKTQIEKKKSILLSDRNHQSKTFDNLHGFQ